MPWPALLLAACVVAAPADAGEGGAAAAFEGVGRVVAVDAKNGTVTIDHEDIPGLMPAMRMRFNVERRADLAGLKKGDAVRFSLGSRGDEMVIVSIAPASKAHQSTF
jgi:Cu/Ag efflux protein CusF